MIVIAHRGANHEALENSWAAFHAGVDAGVDRIELDVRITRDGHPVIMHDDSLQRTTSSWEKVSSLTIHEIRKIRLLNGEAIPELDQVIRELLPKVEINIELKGDIPELTHAAATMVMNAPDRDKVIFSSFDGSPLRILRDEYPSIRRACLWGRWPTRVSELSNLAPQLMLDRYETNIFHPRAAMVDENLMEQASIRELEVYAWDALVGGEEKDREALWIVLKTLGVDGFCSNYPRQFQTWLKETKLDELKFVS